jgi:tetratricopeptide (TPR) repeat protein
MFYKGIVLGKIKKHEEALNCFENVYKKHPTHLDALFHKGIELAEMEKHEKAIEIFSKILLKHKDNGNIIYAKSRSAAALGNYPESIELLKKAISLNGKTIREWAKKEKIFEKLHDNDQFRKIVKL